jgi:hypothetical protein
MKDKNDKPYRHEAVEEDVPEFMSGMVDDLDYIPRNERLGRAGRLKNKHRSKWLLAIAAAVLLLIVLLAAAFDNEGQKEGTVETLETNLLRIEKRIDALESKIARIEKGTAPGLPENKTALSQLKSQERYHTVRPGDSLSAIAAKYGITVDMLCKWNHLTVDEPIKPDQKLLISPD